ncbi:MAG: hypothetical protein ACLVJH_09270 [Faecalibacterium prausnitzii]
MLREKYGKHPAAQGHFVYRAGHRRAAMYPVPTRTAMRPASCLALVMLSSLAASGGIPVTMLLVAALYFASRWPISSLCTITWQTYAISWAAVR